MWRFTVALVLLTAHACKSEPKNHSSPNESERPTVAPDDAMSRARPFDPAALPLTSLRSLADVSLEAAAPCDATLGSLGVFIDALKTGVAALATETSAASATVSLRRLAETLTPAAEAIEERTETEEMRRLTAEVRAASRDLSEALQAVAESIDRDDVQGLARIRGRIDNGVDNLKLAVEGLQLQCEP